MKFLKSILLDFTYKINSDILMLFEQILVNYFNEGISELYNANQ